ncbi:phosphatidylglycerophosphatase A family protein [Fuchsiella alkaliacetigena]|uniref:phosphatidylglycerophosphatase A family protein n=1 Tax=Fuchsiella alkaliacetigena TaxID=957042 RepID=UPI00200A368D|nr:phosphatidylglycerophosphatase A [Fuchsiella alkaliacetigena]MCK8825555.1 phosphatidylglycerophosphatase A [Fuchsiella alkaliacetigena]
MKELVIELLNKRGVTVEPIAEIAYDLQVPYNPELTLEDCIIGVEEVLGKRDVQYAILTGIALDKLAENGALDEPLASIIKSDEPLYGIDESLAMAIANIYGTIGVTSFGYLDKKKVGLIKKLDNDLQKGRVNTFLDDIVAGVASAASAKLAYQAEEGRSKNEKEAL